MLESTEHRSHPLRLELDNFFLVQVRAGPQRSRVVSIYLNSLGWLTVVGLPILLLLYFQVVFLPYHDVQRTLLHWGLLVADLLVLGLFGVFVLRAEENYFWAFARGVTHSPGSFTLGLVVLGGAAFLSIFVATVPDLRDDRDTVRCQGRLFVRHISASIIATDKALPTGK